MSHEVVSCFIELVSLMYSCIFKLYFTVNYLCYNNFNDTNEV